MEKKLKSTPATPSTPSKYMECQEYGEELESETEK